MIICKDSEIAFLFLFYDISIYLHIWKSVSNNRRGQRNRFHEIFIIRLVCKLKSTQLYNHFKKANDIRGHENSINFIIFALGFI